jgi:hypothetical protein
LKQAVAGSIPAAAAYMNELCILYLHHKNDEVTRYHYSLLLKHNLCPVVPIFCRDANPVEPLENALEVRKTFSGVNWANADQILAEWYRTSRIEAERYICLDWDCLATIPLKDWYKEVWNDDFVGSEIRELGDGWHWFKDFDFLPAKYREYACGNAPCNGIMLSNRALNDFSQVPCIDNVFSEFRITTVLRSLGYEIKALPLDKAKFNVWRNCPILDEPGLYHPVKEMPP